MIFQAKLLKPSWEVVEGGQSFMYVFVFIYDIFLYHPRWWFQSYVCCLHVDTCLGHDSIWLMFLNWVETTNVKYIYSHSVYIYHIITYISGESKSESPISLGRCFGRRDILTFHGTVFCHGIHQPMWRKLCQDASCLAVGRPRGAIWIYKCLETSLEILRTFNLGMMGCLLGGGFYNFDFHPDPGWRYLYIRLYI